MCFLSHKVAISGHQKYQCFVETIKLNNKHKVFTYLAHNKPSIHFSYHFNKKGRERNISHINFIPTCFKKGKFATCKNHVDQLLNSTASTILKKREEVIDKISVQQK